VSAVVLVALLIAAKDVDIKSKKCKKYLPPPSFLFLCAKAATAFSAS